jgi:hypothetical protein
MSVAVASSPLSDDKFAWEKSNDWSSSNRAISVFVLVYISPELIDAAVEYWAEINNQKTPNAKEKAREKLRKCFLKTGNLFKSGEKAFFLLLKPIKATGFPDEWAVKIGSISENSKIVTIDGTKGEVTKTEKFIEQKLYSTPEILSCLIYFEDPVDEETEPSFNITIENIYYYIRNNEYQWLKAKEPRTVIFRFETGEVKILSMIKRGIPWEDIKKKHIEPWMRFSSDSLGKAIFSFIIDLAFGFFKTRFLKFI